MKTKLFQHSIVWLLAFSIGLVACKKDDGPETQDPYAPITEGRIFLPVLAPTVDMDKVKKVEEKRNGKLEKMTPADPKAKRDYDLYQFIYDDKDIGEVQYHVHMTSKILLKVAVKVRNEAIPKLQDLAKKNGFDETHFISKMFSKLSRERDALFLLSIRKTGGVTWFVFDQYGKQPKPMPTIKEIDKKWDEKIENSLFKYARVKQIEEGTFGGRLLETKKVTYGKHKGKIRYAKFRAKSDEYPMIIRGYFFDWDEELSDGNAGWISEIIYVYDDPALGFYQDNIKKVDIPTKEMLALLAKEGYVFYEARGKAYFFKNERKKQIYVLRTQGFDDIEGGKKVLALNLFNLK